MKYELWGVAGIIFCIIVTVIEYIIHFRLAQRHENEKNTTEYLEKQLTVLIESTIYAPTDNALDQQICTLAEKIGGCAESYELALECFKRAKENHKDDDIEQIDRIIALVDEKVRPVDIYAEMLANGDVYHKGYACRRLADMGAVQYKEAFVKLTEAADRDLSYNAAMALCTLGDAQSVCNYIKQIQGDKTYSARMINEFYDEFKGDRAEFSKLLLSDCNHYMKCTVIKAMAPFKLKEFKPMYQLGFTENDKQLQIACIKALAPFGDPEDEQTFCIAAQNNDWVIRSAALQGLALINSPSALRVVKSGLYDKEWWVRQTAAKALVSMNVSPKDIEEILSGYDRFAADALKSVLYKEIEL